MSISSHSISASSLHVYRALLFCVRSLVRFTLSPALSVSFTYSFTISIHYFIRLLRSRCCGAALLLEADAAEGLLISCLARACAEPVLQIPALPEEARKAAWGKWIPMFILIPS